MNRSILRSAREQWTAMLRVHQALNKPPMFSLTHLIAALRLHSILFCLKSIVKVFFLSSQYAQVRFRIET